MRQEVRALAIGALALAIVGVASASATMQLGPVTVRLPQRPSVGANVSVAFNTRGQLPNGGYYYAVIVLEEYPRSLQSAHPPCAVSSDMRRTPYGYPRRGRPVRLTLTPAPSSSNHWCPGGGYIGAVYAVPHKPRCSRSYPCYGTSTQNSSCWEIEGRVVCGVAVIPRFSYPGGLPKPIDRTARVVGHFQISFPGAPIGSAALAVRSRP